MAYVYRFVDIITRPVRDYMDALQACMRGASLAYAALIAVGFALSWWVYVPIHELCHAWGCLLTGGDVTRLEIDWIYGAPLLARMFPYVTVGSEYAGQLTGFDTHGNDLCYLATDFLPFVLTIFVGVPLLRASAHARTVGQRCLLLGVALPIAYAPFVSLTGDYYEMGSIVVSRAIASHDPTFPLARWRSDDIFKLGGELATQPDATVADAMGVTASFLVGLVLALATYWLGVMVADLIVRHDAASR